LSWKNNVQSPEPKFKNKQSLSYIINDVFVYFQEGSGDAVNYFWHQIKDSGLEFKRENKLEKIIKRKKIKSKIEYDCIIDIIIPYQQEGIINDDEVNLLHRLLLDFENL